MRNNWWYTVGVEADFGWPIEDTEIEYLGHKYLLRPESDTLSQSISLSCPEKYSMKTANLLVNRFLSALSWSEFGGINITSSGTGGSKPILIGKSNGRFISKGYKVDYLPEPKDDKSKRALALFREAKSVNSIAYSFLGFYKVLNVIFSTGSNQKDWININLINVKGFSSSERLEELKKEHTDLGEYFYLQGRCAIAHSFNDPVVDPDIPSDILRLSKDLPLIQELAEIAIEKELKIITKSTFHDLHLYELQGFVNIFGKNIINSLKNGERINEKTEYDIPIISLRLRNSDLFPSYEGLIPVNVIQDKYSLKIQLNSKDNILQLVIILDFKNWRLIFNPVTQVKVKDDGTSRPMFINSETALFAKGKYSNGQIEIYNTESKQLLARTDPFIPCNIDLRETIKNFENWHKESLKKAEEREANEN